MDSADNLLSIVTDRPVPTSATGNKGSVRNCFTDKQRSADSGVPVQENRPGEIAVTGSRLWAGNDNYVLHRLAVVTHHLQ